MKSQILIWNLVFISWIFLSSCLFAEHIENFEVNITLEPSGEFVVTESIVYDFNGTQKHGIYREIPIKAYTGGSVKDVKWSLHFDIQLEDIEVQMNEKDVAWTKEFSGSLGQEVIVIKIGSKDKTVSGQKSYTIKYRCRNAITPSSFQDNTDSLHWSVVGNGWKVPILHIEANLFLPPELHRNNLIIVTPLKSDKSSTWINEHHLHIKTDQYATSLKIVFPRGLLLQDTELKIAKGRQNLKDIVEKKEQKKIADEKFIHQLKQDTLLRQENRRVLGVWSWILFFMLLSIVWFKRDALGLKKDTKSIVVRYEAPKNFSVLQAGMLFDKNLDDNDFYAAILELTYLEHVQIEETNGNVVLHKVIKSRDKLSADQWQLLDALFETKEYFSLKETTSSGYAKLFSKVSGIYNTLYIWAKKQGYTVGNLNKTRQRSINIIFVVLLPLFILSIVLAINTDYAGEEVSYILFCIFTALLPWIIASFFNHSFRVQVAVLFLGIGLWFVLMGLDIFPKQRGMGTEDVVSSYVTVMFLLLIFSIAFVWKIGRYTQKGADVVRELKGLEMFVKSVKEDEIKRRLAEDADYMEKMLPYAMLFGQVEHWLKMYDILNIPLSKQKRYTLLKSLIHSNMLRTPTKSGSS